VDGQRERQTRSRLTFVRRSQILPRRMWGSARPGWTQWPRRIPREPWSYSCGCWNITCRSLHVRNAPRKSRSNRKRCESYSCRHRNAPQSLMLRAAADDRFRARSGQTARLRDSPLTRRSGLRKRSTSHRRSLRKLQFPLDRLEARLLAQRIEQRVDLQVLQR